MQKLNDFLKCKRCFCCAVGGGSGGGGDAAAAIYIHCSLFNSVQSS
jgi:hypothetical protein